MTTWTGLEILQALDYQASENNLSSTGFSIDSRTLSPGQIFVALDGDTHKGSAYIADAFKKGAAAVITHTPPTDDPSATYFLASDPLQALKDIAKFAVKRSNAKRIAITGSAGKTTTKEWLQTVLSAFGETICSQASYNNHIGVPLSLTQLDRTTNYGVFEVGMNHAGEITPLSTLVSPHMAIITTVAPAHIGYFNSIEEIAHEKSCIFDGLVDGGIILLPRNNPHYDFLYKRAQQKTSQIYSFGGHAEATLRLCEYSIKRYQTRLKFKLNDKLYSLTLSFLGDHYVENALCVILAVHSLGLSIEKAIDILETLTPLVGRGAIEHLQLQNGVSITLIDDAYNANSASMQHGLAVLGKTGKPEARRIAILGEMRELGQFSQKLHEDLLDPIQAAKVDKVFAVGKEMQALYDLLPNSLQGAYGETYKDILDNVWAALQPGDVVFVKGSNGTKVYEIVSYLRQHVLTDRKVS